MVRVGGQRSNNGSSRLRKRGPDLTTKQRRQIVTRLITKMPPGRVKLPHGSVLATAKEFRVARETVSGLWNRFKRAQEDGTEHDAIKSQRKGKSGRKKMPAEEVREKISKLRPRDMTNLRTIVSKAGLSTNMVYRRKDELQLNRATSWQLDPDNQKRRLEWALEHVEGPNPDDPETMMFGDMKRIIHIDEKCSSLKAVKKSYWVMDGKQTPVRKVAATR